MAIARTVPYKLPPPVPLDPPKKRTIMGSLYIPPAIASQIVPQVLEYFDQSSHSEVLKGQIPQSKVAVKKVKPYGHAQGIGTPQLEHAMKQWERATHSNVLRFFGLWKSPLSPFPVLVTSFLEWNIIDYVSAMPGANKYSLIFPIALALEYMHQQNPPVLHGNIKGSNILVDRTGKAYLSDIGIYKALSKPDQVDPEVRWKAPEIVLDNKPHSTACDVWSFAMTILEVYTHERPFCDIPFEASIVVQMKGVQIVPRRPSNAIPDESLWRLLQQCWSYSPSERPGMSKVISQLRSLRGQARGR